MNRMSEQVEDRFVINHDGTVDDVVLRATSVHIEDLGDRFWIGVERADGDRFTFEVSATMPKSSVTCMMVESSVGSTALETKPEVTDEAVREAMAFLKQTSASMFAPRCQESLAIIEAALTTERAYARELEAKVERLVEAGKRAADDYCTGACAGCGDDGDCPNQPLVAVIAEVKP